MVKEYRYRPHIRWGQYIFPIMSGILILCCWIFAWILLIIDRTIPQTHLIIGASFVSGIIGLEGGFLWWIFYRMAGISVSLDETAIIYRNRQGTTIIPFEMIRFLEFPSLKYLGGWIKILSPNKTIRLTVVLDHFGEFLQALKAMLDHQHPSVSYNRKRFFRFYKTAVYCDQSWDRLYVIFWKLFGITLISTLLAICFAKWSHLQLFGILLWGGLSWFWTTIVFLVTEIIFIRQIAKSADEENFSCSSRNVRFEKKVYRNALFLGTLLYAVVSFLVLGFFL